MRKKIWLIGIAVVFVGVIGIISLQKSKKKEPETIKIGAILPLTGSGAYWGENARKGILLALEEINKTGGIKGKKVEVIFEDSQSIPKGAINAFNKLISVHKIQCSIVDMISSNVLAIAPIAEKQKVVILSPGASSPQITYAGEYTFRNWPSDALQGEELAKVVKKLGYNKVGLLYIENAFGEGLKKVFTKVFEEKGGKVLIAEPLKQGEANFRAQITQIKSANPEAIVLFIYPPEALKLIKQIRENIIKVQLFATAEIEDPIILKLKEADGLIYIRPQPPDQNDKEVAHFVSAYKEKYKEEPGIVSDVAYDALKLLYKVIKEKGYNGTAIKEGLLKIKEYHGASGIITFDENGDVIKPFIVKNN